MRISRAVVLLAIGLLLVVVGCSKQVSGTAQRDPQLPALAVSQDGFGITAGFANAPTDIEIFTEPQCSHCADLQADFGNQLAYYIAVGQLKVTYRPMTFLDQHSNGYSARVSNAMFLVAQGDATGTQFQRFVMELWGHQEPKGDGPSYDKMAEMAKKVGMPDKVVQRVRGGASAVDVVEMDNSNFEFLYEIDSLNTGTPTVYDLSTGEKIDIFDNNWLNKLIQS
jgi:protein-disulfide isomerase